MPSAHQDAYEFSIHADGVLGAAWAQIGEGLLGLLNGERGRLDGGTLDRAIRDLLEPPPPVDIPRRDETDEDGARWNEDSPDMYDYCVVDEKIGAPSRTRAPTPSRTGFWWM